MKNPYIKSIKDLCIQALKKGERLFLLYRFETPRSRCGWYVFLKGYGHSRCYASYDFAKNMLERACSKYNVNWVEYEKTL